MVVLIPARGGSKGLPGKNVKLLEGKPLIAYTIEAAHKTKSIEEVYVSTNCFEIKNISESYGAQVPFLRPEYLASDDALAIDSYLHFIDFYETRFGKKLDFLVILLPTTPLRNFKHIEEAIQLFLNKNADSVIAYTREYHPIGWHKIIDNEFRIMNYENNLKNRQNETITYFPNGSIFIFKTDLLKNYKYYSENSFAYLMDRKYSVDIDTIEDFEYAEFLIKREK